MQGRIQAEKENGRFSHNQDVINSTEAHLKYNLFVTASLNHIANVPLSESAQWVT